MYVLYSKPNCPFCVRAKDLLVKEGVDFDSVDLVKNPDQLERLKGLGCRTVPQIFIQDDDGNEVEHVGGFDQLCDHFGYLKQC